MEENQWGERWRRMAEKVDGIRSIHGRYKIDGGEVKNSMGNGETKELICMTHGDALRWGNAGGRGGAGRRGIKWRKKWDNCNSIINKIY